MAKDSPIAKLAAKPLQFQIGVLVGTMVFLGVLYYQFFYSSLEEELASAQQLQNRVEKENTTLKTREKEWKKMVEDKKNLDRELANNQVSLPKTASLASFMGHMQRQAAVAGVSFKNWSRRPEVTVGSYVKVPISIAVVGSFHQILKYFHLLSTTKRIISIENFSMTPEKARADEVLLKAAFLATTFRQAGPAFQLPKKPTAKKKETQSSKAATGVNRLKQPAQTPLSPETVPGAK